MEQNSFNKRLTIRRRLHGLLAVALLIGVMSSTGCSEGDDTDVSNVSGSKNAQLTEADIKSLSSVNSETFLSVDGIGGQPAKPGIPVVINAKTTPSFAVTGWAADQRAQTEAGGIIINIDGNKDILANFPQSRPDVAAHLKGKQYTNSGFIATVDASSLTKGRHILTVRVVTADRKGYFEPKDKYEVEIQ